MINVIGIGFGVTCSGLFVDWLIANEIDSPIYHQHGVLYRYLLFGYPSVFLRRKAF